MVNPTPPAISVEDIECSYASRKVLRGVSFQVPPSSIHGLLGRNGAGKTTLLRVLATLATPERGCASIMGYDVVLDAASVRRNIGVVGHATGLPRLDWRIPDYLTYAGALHDLSAQQTRERALPLLNILLPGLADDARLHQMSAGMRKKLELIRAFLPAPQVLLLDEPTAELDLPAKTEMWESFRTWARQDGTTLLVTSHDPSEIEAICDTVTILRDGIVTYEGMTAEIGQRAAFREELVQLM